MERDNSMLLPEIEAAHALAALAHAASCSMRSSTQDQAAATSHENKYTMATTTHRDAASNLCCKSNRWNSASKSRRNLTEAEKEARRLHRILANRESARQTIRRRQAMHMELMRKAVDLSEENDNLKKEVELAVTAYDSLKSRNRLLKLQVADAKKAQSREMKEESKSSQAEKPSTPTTSLPLSLYNSQPSLIPFLWPSPLSSNVIHYQCPSPSDVISLSESFLQHRHISPSLPWPEGNSLFAFPLPWILPFPSYVPMLRSCSDTEKRTNETPSTHHCSVSSSSENLFAVENNESSSKPNMLMNASSCTDSMPLGSAFGARLTYPWNSSDHHTGLHSGVTLLTPEKLSCIRPTRHSFEDDTSNLYPASSTKNVSETLPKKNEELVICHQKKPENIFSAIKARRRRKELMGLRNVKYHEARTHTHNHSANS